MDFLKTLPEKQRRASAVFCFFLLDCSCLHGGADEKNKQAKGKKHTVNIFINSHCSAGKDGFLYTGIPSQIVKLT